MAKDLKIRIGKDAEGKAYTMNLNSAPHMLVGGCTGSGKSVFVNSLITQLIGNNNPNEVKLYLGDPKRVEFSIFKDAPHVEYIAKTLEEHDFMIWSLINEMNERYKAMELRGIKDIVGVKSFFPNIVVFLDEFGNLVLDKKYNGKVAKRIQDRIIMLAQMGRAAGITMVISTQYPNAKIVDTNIKAQFPTRICFKVATHIESNVILGKSGGEELRGKGHMYMLNPSKETKILELQGFNFRDDAISRVVKLSKIKAG